MTRCLAVDESLQMLGAFMWCSNRFFNVLSTSKQFLEENERRTVLQARPR